MLQFNPKRSLDENVGLLIAVSDVMFCEKNPIKILWLLVANYLSQWAKAFLNYHLYYFILLNFTTYSEININFILYQNLNFRKTIKMFRYLNFKCDCRKDLTPKFRISKMRWRMQNIGKNCKLCPLVADRVFDFQ